MKTLHEYVQVILNESSTHINVGDGAEFDRDEPGDDYRGGNGSYEDRVHHHALRAGFEHGKDYEFHSAKGIITVHNKNMLNRKMHPEVAAVLNKHRSDHNVNRSNPHKEIK